MFGLAKTQNFCRSLHHVMSTYRGVLHKGEEARISNLVFVKDVEKFEEESNVLFFFLVDKFLESCKVNRSVD